jgi:outer membrane protein W
MLRNRLLLLLILVPFMASSQFSKGTLVPGISFGTLFFESGKTDYSAAPPTTGYTSNRNSLGFQLAPSIGRFVNDRVLLGARLIARFEYDKYIDAANNITFRKKEDRVSEWGLGLFSRYYFITGEKWLPFGQFQVDGGIGQTRTEGFEYSNNYREDYLGKSKGNFFISSGLQLGLTRMLNSNVGIDFSAGYLFTHRKTKTRTDTFRDVDLDGQTDEQLVSEITAKTNDHGFTLQAGIQVYF